MSELMMSNERKGGDFEIHPEGTFMAVCRDIWIERKPNDKYPGTNQWGNPEPEQLVKVCIDFLTDDPIEINGEMMPRFMRFKANQSWGDKSSLRDFVTRWNPAVGRAEKADLETLVGTGAYLTISHSEPKDGKVWANITSVAPPPKGASIPKIPSGFVRHKDKAAEPQQPAPQRDEHGVPF